MKRKILPLLLTALLCLTLLGGCQNTDESSGSSSSSSVPDPEPVYVLNPLTGEDGFAESALGKRPVAVMVSNVKQSLPQWGIGEADLVYEAVTEGGITRLMCMFANPDEIPNIGPVRSVREYFPQFSEPFGALFVHFGGSTTGYDAVSEYKVNNIDGMALSSVCFKQDTSRIPTPGKEHSYYTNSELIKVGIERKDYKTEGECPAAFSFVKPDETASLTGEKVDKATVRFSGYTTAVFDYDKGTKSYLKSQYGQPHIDANTQKQVAVDNVLILYAPTTGIGDTILTRYELTSGGGYYLSQGGSQEVSWSKGKYDAMFKITDEDGKTVSFNPGKTWVCVVPASEKSATVLETAAGDASNAT